MLASPLQAASQPGHHDVDDGHGVVHDHDVDDDHDVVVKEFDEKNKAPLPGHPGSLL